MNQLSIVQAKQELTAGQDKVELLIDHMKNCGIKLWDKTAIPLQEKLIGRLYLRTIFLPRGMLAVGEILLRESVFNVVKGKGVMWLPAESRSVIIEQGCAFSASPGSRKVIMAVEDCVFTSIHPVDEGTILANVQEQCVANGFDDVVVQNYINYVNKG